MSDTTFFNTTNPKPQTIPVDVRGYTWPRRLTIIAWALLTTVIIALTAFDFACFNAGSELFWDISWKLVPNYEFAKPVIHHFSVPLIDWGRYPSFFLSVCLGIKTLLALFVPPAIRTHHVRFELTEVPAPQKK